MFKAGSLRPTRWALKLVLVLLVIDQFAACQPGNEPEPETKASDSLGIISWATFTRMFNKSYSSLTQQLVRHKLFIVKQLQVCLAFIKWTLKLAPNYLVINKFSDLAPHEELRLLSGDQDDETAGAGDEQLGEAVILADEQVARLLEEELEGAGSLEQSSSSSSARAGRQKRDVESALRHKAAKHIKPPMGLLDVGNSIPQASLVKPSLGLLDVGNSIPQASLVKPSLGLLDVRDLVRLPSNQHLVVRAKHPNLKWWVPTENPFYTPHVLFSRGAKANKKETIDDIPEDQIAKVEEVATGWLAESAPALNRLAESARSGLSWVPPTVTLDSPASSNEPPTRADGGPAQADETVQAHDQTNLNVVHKDWRDTGCIAPPYFQGNCFSCYAISSMAFIEWAYCMNRNRVLTPLSAQYLVSCGPQFMEESAPKLKVQFNGCSMGRSRHALLFVKEYGAELEVHIPYLAEDVRCPVEPNTPTKLKGYLRPNVKPTIRMGSKTNQLDKALNVGPVVVVFRAPVNFVAYGGGMIQNCYQEGSHAMLIVGHGVENNIPYLLIKNSFGTDWGEGGYFKFDRRFTQECIREFFLPRVRFPSHKSQARRIKAYSVYKQSEGNVERVEPGNFETHIDKLVSDNGRDSDTGDNGIGA